MALENLYREVILDHYRSPRNQAPLGVADASADDGAAGELLPPASRFAIVHDGVEMPEPTGVAEQHFFAVERAEVDRPGVAQRAVGDDDGPAGNGVVDDFVPHQHADRVGPCDEIESHGQNRLVIADALYLADRPEVRLDDGRD